MAARLPRIGVMWAGAWLVGALVVASACSDADESAAPGGSGGTGASSSGSAGFEPLGGSGQGGSEGCLTAVIEGERKTVIMLIVMDRSGSMAPTWSSIGDALGGFFTAASSKGISAGFNFFPPPGLADSCDVSDYDPPQYTVGPLPGHAGTLIQVLDTMILGGETPTHAGLAGSLDWAVGYQLEHPELDVVVVMASDGDPTTCDTNIDSISTLAADALAAAGVRTFAVAIQGATLSNLDLIAAAGGTGQALDVTADASALEDKMNEIRAVTVACELVIPDPDPVNPFDPKRVNVNLDPDGSGGDPAGAIPQVAGESGCQGEQGWYYDYVDEPTKVFLCPATCDLLRLPNASVEFAFGCPTIVK